MTAVAVVGDTGALLAAYAGEEPDHDACRKAMHTVGHLVISPLVLAELDYLAHTALGPVMAMRILDDIIDRCAIGRFEVPEVGAHLATARAVMRQYPALNIGLTDAINVALAAEFRTDAVLTVDRRHFRAIRPLTNHKAFRLLPDDLDG
ncbi:PIN domain-containing protein [Kitasatospora sp. SUK 42]|uniref:PIN domain-containing protein n=1 Tax=Kitasatospora sp. SUK 42 TaxID=1588882 RepID=UPI0018CAF2F4|nr:PIN domain-containing protein [Kitasatospora sp. SUK 42]MBV2154250.1 PIN domain-containing protein [Kitasatospora sp. SUK 42]